MKWQQALWLLKDLHYIYFYIYAFSRHFYPKRLTVHSGYTCFGQYAPGMSVWNGNFCIHMALLDCVGACNMPDEDVNNHFLTDSLNWTVRFIEVIRNCYHAAFHLVCSPFCLPFSRSQSWVMILHLSQSLTKLTRTCVHWVHFARRVLNVSSVPYRSIQVLW